MERKWACGVCKTRCEIDWLRCPNCGHTIFDEVTIFEESKSPFGDMEK